MIVREATAADWSALQELFLATPLQAGTSFVLDRSPDFGALPAMRGSFKTFIALDEQGIAGVITALWRTAREGTRRVVVGELLDLRVTQRARGQGVTFQLLSAANEAFAAANVEAVLCLIGKKNQQAQAVTTRWPALPRLDPLEDFASVHIVAMKRPRLRSGAGLSVREAGPADAALIQSLSDTQFERERFSPTAPMIWPDPTGQSRAWIAFASDGAPAGLLVVWNGAPVRRLRVMRYSWSDLPLRLFVGVASTLGFCEPLPLAGNTLGMWATRLVCISRGGSATLARLLDIVLRSAVESKIHLVQVNLPARSPFLAQLPRLPRSTYWTTLFAGPRSAAGAAPHYRTGDAYHADLARI